MFRSDQIQTESRPDSQTLNPARPGSKLDSQMQDLVGAGFTDGQSSRIRIQAGSTKTTGSRSGSSAPLVSVIHWLIIDRIWVLFHFMFDASIYMLKLKNHFIVNVGKSFEYLTSLGWFRSGCILHKIRLDPNPGGSADAGFCRIQTGSTKNTGYPDRSRSGPDAPLAGDNV